MVQLIAEQTRKACKDHSDDSAAFIIEALDIIRHGYLDCGKVVRLTFTELRSIAQLKANDWKIKKGQVYVRQFNNQDGELFTFKTLPHILKICLKYKLYGDL